MSMRTCGTFALDIVMRRRMIDVNTSSISMYVCGCGGEWGSTLECSY